MKAHNQEVNHSSSSVSRHDNQRFSIYTTNKRVSACFTGVGVNVQDCFVSKRNLRTKVDITCYLTHMTTSFIPDKLLRRFCVNSGASHDLWNDINDFVEYEDISDRGMYVAIADNSQILIIGRGTIQMMIGDKIIWIQNLFYVPLLDMSLLSIRQHAKKGNGCSYLHDKSSGCFLSFPTFIVEIDDSRDVTLPFLSCSHELTPDYADMKTSRCQRQARLNARRADYLSKAISA